MLPVADMAPEREFGLGDRGVGLPLDTADSGAASSAVRLPLARLVEGIVQAILDGWLVDRLALA